MYTHWQSPVHLDVEVVDCDIPFETPYVRREYTSYMWDLKLEVVN